MRFAYQLRKLNDLGRLKALSRNYKSSCYVAASYTTYFALQQDVAKCDELELDSVVHKATLSLPHRLYVILKCSIRAFYLSVVIIPMALYGFTSAKFGSDKTMELFSRQLVNVLDGTH